jgi:hypothetical protein
MKGLAHSPAPWILGLATLAASVAICVHNHHPDLPHPLSLTLTLDPWTDDSSQPLVVTGRTGLADFLHVTPLDAQTVVFGYDSWGTPGLRSEPVSMVPGAALQVEMPGLWNIAGTAGASPHLRIVYDGKVVLEEDVSSHPRNRATLYFAENPTGGTCARPVLHGRLQRANGRRLQGSVSGYFSVGERLHAWIKVARWQLVAVLLLSLGAGRFEPRLRRTLMRRLRALRSAMAQWRRHLVFMLSAAVCTLAFGLTLIHGKPDFVHLGYLRAFYDFQAASLLDGHLDVARDALKGEAFLFEGRAYGYFGIVPALLRLPFVFFDVGFGALTDVFMIVEHFGCLLFAYLILGLVWPMVRPNSRPRSWAVVVLLAHLGLGSTLFFLSSRGFLYHEAVLSGLCFALAAAYFSLRYLTVPERCWWAHALVCGTLSVHCRPPLGLFALCLVGATALSVVLRPLFAAGTGDRWTARLPRFWPRHLTVGLLAVLAVLSFNGLSYLKFRTFDGAPFRYHEQYDPERLARFEGKNFHWSNLPLNTSAYLLRPRWGLRAHFPYLITRAHEPGPGSKAKMDLTEPMLGLPFAMPGLFWLALGGMLSAFWWRRQLRPLVLVLGMAAFPMGLALLAAVATSQRYTADFLPFLVCAAALGTAMLDSLWTRLRILGRSLAVLTTVAAILITLALTLRYQGELIWDVPDSTAERYRKLGNAVDGLLGIRPEPGSEATP